MGIVNVLPILVGVILLVSMIQVLVPKHFYQSLFTGNTLKDSVIGSAIGSVLAGNPVSAYILGGGFLKNGVSLTAVSAFIVAWTTVGIVQLPAESMLLGKKFAIYRNITAFVFAIVVAVITTGILNLL